MPNTSESPDKEQDTLGGVIATRDDLIWAAAFFDGEGCVTIGTRKTRSPNTLNKVYFAPAIVVANGERFILEWFQARWGGHVSQPSIIPAAFDGARKLFSRPRQHWAVTYLNFLRFGKAIQPYVKIKRAILANGLRMAAIQTKHHRGVYTPAEYAVLKKLHLRHKQLSHRGKP